VIKSIRQRHQKPVESVGVCVRAVRFEWPTVAFVARRAQGEGVLHKPGGLEAAGESFVVPVLLLMKNIQFFFFQFWRVSFGLGGQIDGCVFDPFVIVRVGKEAAVRRCQTRGQQQKEEARPHSNKSDRARPVARQLPIYCYDSICGCCNTHTQ
jgi:hypothetical protein